MGERIYMKVLIADRIAQEGIDALSAYSGITPAVLPGISHGDLLRTIRDYDGLIVRSATKVTRDIIHAANGLKVIGRAGSGVDNIDVAAAKERGIVVMNTPGGNADSVAEFTLGMLFVLARRIFDADSSMKQGKWEKQSFVGVELSGKILGIVGCGQVGRRVSVAARSLGMHAIACDPYLECCVFRDLDVEQVEMGELLKRSDFITIHVPKTAETIRLIDERAIAQMKHGVYVVNCSRGGIVVEDDLLNALDAGTIAGAAVDVYETEPPGKNRLTQHPRIIATPHIGALTKEAQTKVAVMIARQVGDYLTGGVAANLAV